MNQLEECVNKAGKKKCRKWSKSSEFCKSSKGQEQCSKLCKICTPTLTEPKEIGRFI